MFRLVWTNWDWVCILCFYGVYYFPWLGWWILQLILITCVEHLAIYLHLGLQKIWNPITWWSEAPFYGARGMPGVPVRIFWEWQSHGYERGVFFCSFCSRITITAMGTTDTLTASFNIEDEMNQGKVHTTISFITPAVIVHHHHHRYLCRHPYESKGKTNSKQKEEHTTNQHHHLWWFLQLQHCN